MKQLFKTPYFWILFIATSFGSLFVAYHYFPQAFPIIHLDLTMNRSQAITQAKEITSQLELGPQDGYDAASFVTDEQVKTFVELEAGGKDAFVAMMDQNFYQPYTWNVRQFKPYEHNEVTIRFTPDGKPYGFEEKISENITRNNVSKSEAKKIAKKFASSEPWNIDFEKYKHIETSQETKASGRIDHTVEYERNDITIGDGFYRLKLVVSGDSVSALHHSVKVPDAFTRRYQEMRSANETISYAASLVTILLYILGGVFVGLVFLFRKRWIIWRTPLLWAVGIAGLGSLNTANTLPLLWMSYNTAIAPFGFISQLAIMMLFSFLILSLITAAIFICAEGLTRKAFGNQIQLWHLFRPSIASSYSILGYTVAGYLLVPIAIAYGVLFYLVTTHLFNWWIPSSALFNPNILATYFPWFQSITVSLQAGFVEECLFRAIPLACAALLGNRFGRRNWWIAGAFILQAIVFGAAHASYPTQPAYARLVELIGISALFGGIYLRFGLLMSIIVHFLYDVFWFALPIFVSTAPYALANKFVVALVAAVPLFIVLIARLRKGAWLTIPESFYNKAWHASETKKVEPQAPPSQTTRSAVPIKQSYLFLIAGIVGIVAWSVFTPFGANSPSFSTTRSDILSKSTLTLEEKQVNDRTWYPLVYPLNQLEMLPNVFMQHRFIWQEGDKELYRSLLGKYLTTQQWVARFVIWDGTITERSEEHHFYFLSDGNLYRYAHKLPESAPGKSLSKEDAQQKALEVIEKQFNHTPEQLNEVSSVANKQPERLDWTITYASKTDYPLEKGEARIVVTIAGDEIVDTYQYIHVPEQWERTYTNKQLVSNNIIVFCVLIQFILLLLCALFAFTRWRIQINYVLFNVFIILSAILLFELINSWPLLLAQFNTSQPFTEQLFRAFGIQSIMVILRAAALTAMIVIATQIKTIYHGLSPSRSLTIGLSFGAIVAGSLALLKWFLPTLSPLWAYYLPLGSIIPFTNGISDQFLAYLSVTINLLLLLALFDTITNYWQQRKIVGIILFALAGFIGAGLMNAYNIPLFIATGITLAILFVIGYFVAARFDRSIIPIATGMYIILQLAQQALFNAYPYALFTNIAAIVIIAGVSWYWYKKLRDENN